MTVYNKELLDKAQEALDGLDEESRNAVVQAVSQGAQLLDNKVPHWREKINLETLDITSLDDCILGQCFHGEGEDDEIGYYHGKRVLGIEDCAGSYGFNGGAKMTAGWQVYLCRGFVQEVKEAA